MAKRPYELKYYNDVTETKAYLRPYLRSEKKRKQGQEQVLAHANPQESQAQPTDYPVLGLPLS